MPRLTEQERQEIVRFIEADRPLPEKYRFLLFEDKREVELVWNGKTSEVCNIVLPFQVIEQVDEPRAEKPAETALQMDMFSLDGRGRQLKGWTNKLIWGDNKLILSSLKNGPLREEIEKQGGIKVMAIDPPFDVGADFSMDIEIPSSDRTSDTFTKKPNILEEIAYRDTWGKGADSFIAMIYERLVLMRDLLAEDGSIYVHCDWRVNSFIRLVLDEIFGANLFRSEIIWKRKTGRGQTNKVPTEFGTQTDTILFYSKTSNNVFRDVTKPLRDEYVRGFKNLPMTMGESIESLTYLAQVPDRILRMNTKDIHRLRMDGQFPEKKWSSGIKKEGYIFLRKRRAEYRENDFSMKMKEKLSRTSGMIYLLQAPSLTSA